MDALLLYWVSPLSYRAVSNLPTSPLLPCSLVPLFQQASCLSKELIRGRSLFVLCGKIRTSADTSSEQAEFGRVDQRTRSALYALVTRSLVDQELELKQALKQAQAQLGVEAPHIHMSSYSI